MGTALKAGLALGYGLLAYVLKTKNPEGESDAALLLTVLYIGMAISELMHIADLDNIMTDELHENGDHEWGDLIHRL